MLSYQVCGTTGSTSAYSSHLVRMCIVVILCITTQAGFVYVRYICVSLYCTPLPRGPKQETPCAPCFDQVCTRCSGEEDELLNTQAVEVDGLSVCAAAPSGSTASSSGTTVETLRLRQGYYRTSNQSHVVLECYRKEACNGGHDAANYCASGYKGACEGVTSRAMIGNQFSWQKRFRLAGLRIRMSLQCRYPLSPSCVIYQGYFRFIGLHSLFHVLRACFV